MNDIRECHARQVLERHLRESEKTYRRLFHGDPYPTWVHNIAILCFLVVNDAAATGHGFSQKEFLAMTINDICPEKHPYSPEERLAKHRTKSGELIDVLVAFHDVELEGGHARIVIACRP